MKHWPSKIFEEPANDDARAIGVKIFAGAHSSDRRGKFHKVVSLSQRADLQVRDVFVTYSAPRVVRGMHTSASGFQGDKLVSVLRGSVLDVLVDLRPGSNLGRLCVMELSSEGPAVLIPAGVAHGFQVTSREQAQVLYLTSNAYSPEWDTGVSPLSLPFAWPQPISEISPRDRELPSLISVIEDGGVPCG